MKTRTLGCILRIVILLFSMLLAGCSVTTHHAFIFDDDWNVKLVFGIEPDDIIGVREQVVDDFVNRLMLLMPILSPAPTAAGKELRFETDDFMALDEIAMITRTDDDGHVRIELSLPPLVTATDWSGDPTGPKMVVQLYLPGEVVDANTFDWENDYEMRTVLVGKKRARVIWQLSERHLTRPIRLWAVVDAHLRQ